MELQDPDSWSSLLLVGQDERGRWLVQDTAGRVEGRFRSRETALGFAKSECDLFHGRIELVEAPLIARIGL
ncbi:hypothetical protein [Sphingomonas sp. PR090111-T3T-6A]|uniref:hypothetical protein n=1 Tax=Sphingomonas sp. PR090111-T3T-6A TaxID=685778 RepID=UPI000380F9C6|nr:hypothetical protein [Sphingomonas sp. PR090111-T3T-6A]